MPATHRPKLPSAALRGPGRIPSPGPLLTLALGALLLVAWMQPVAPAAAQGDPADREAAAEGKAVEGEVDSEEEDGAEGEAEAPEPEEDAIFLIRIDSAIQPVVAEFIRDSLETADEARAQLLVIQLSTPGGLSVTTREICTAMLGANTPVAVFVAPSGAHAASAGFFILMASDVAAMAPGTNTGAAAAVSGSGEEIEGTMATKVQEDSAAYIRSLARRTGRNVELAERTVTEEAKAFTAEEALEGNLVELVVPSLQRLLVELDGREMEKNGRTVVLETADAQVRELEMTVFQRFLAAIAEPTIAFMLLSLGGLGIYFELMNPGAIFPGVFGAIALLLAFFALSVLPVNYAGVALILLALAFFVAEIKVQSFGLLTAGGAVSLILGGMMLIKSPDPALQVSKEVLFAVAGVAVVTVAFLFLLAGKTLRSKVRTGAEGMVGEVGVVRDALDPRGKVWVHGELWAAEASQPIPVGTEVEVVAVDGMRIRVRPAGDSASPPPMVQQAEA